MFERQHLVFSDTESFHIELIRKKSRFAAQYSFFVKNGIEYVLDRNANEILPVSTVVRNYNELAISDPVPAEAFRLFLEQARNKSDFPAEKKVRENKSLDEKIEDLRMHESASEIFETATADSFTADFQTISAADARILMGKIARAFVYRETFEPQVLKRFMINFNKFWQAIIMEKRDDGKKERDRKWDFFITPFYEEFFKYVDFEKARQGLSAMVPFYLRDTWEENIVAAQRLLEFHQKDSDVQKILPSEIKSIYSNRIKYLPAFFNSFSPYFITEPEFETYLRDAHSETSATELKESLLDSVYSSEGQAKITAIKKIIDALGADLILSRIFELDLPEAQIENIILYAAEKDTDAVFFHLSTIPVREFSNAEKIITAMFRGATENFIFNFDRFNFSEEEKNSWVIQLMQQKTMAFLVGYDELSRHAYLKPLEKMINEYLSRFGTEEPPDYVSVINSLYEKKSVRSDAVNACISRLCEAAFRDLAKKIEPVLHGFYNAPENWSSVETKAAMDMLFEKIVELKITNGQADVAMATLLAGNIEHTEKLGTELTVRQNNQNYSWEVQKLLLEKLNDTGNIFAFEQFMSGATKIEPKTNEQIEFFIKVFSNIRLLSEYSLAIEEMLEGLPMESFVRLCESAISQDPRVLLSNGRRNEKKFSALPDCVKLLWLESLIDNDFTLIFDNYYWLKLKDQKKERLLVDDWRRKKIPPFDAFPSTAIAVRLLSRPHNCLRLPVPGEQGIELSERIAKSVLFEKRCSPAVFAYLTNKENHYFDWLQLSTENILALNDLFEKNSVLVRQLEEKFNKRFSQDRFLLDFSFGLTPENISRLPWLLAQLSVMEKEAAERSDKQIKYTSLFSDIGGKEAQTFCFLMALENGWPLKRAFAEYVLWYRKSPKNEMFVTDRTYPDRMNRWNFMRENYDLLLPYLNDKSLNTVSVLNVIYSLMPEKRQVFLRQDMRLIVPPGREVAPVIFLLLNFIKKGVLDVGDPLELKIFNEYIAEFGLYDSAALFEQYKVLKREARYLPPALGLGLKAKAKESKESLLNKLRVKLRGLRDDVMLSPEFDSAKYDLNNELVLDALKFTTDFEVSDWNRGQSLKWIIEKFEADRRAGLIAPLSGAYRPEKMSVEKMAVGVDRNISSEAFAQYWNYYCDFEYIHLHQDLLQLPVLARAEILAVINQIIETRNYASIRQTAPASLLELSQRLPNNLILEDFRSTLRQSGARLLPILIDFERKHDLNRNELTTTWIRRLVFAASGNFDYENFMQMVGQLKDSPDLSNLESMIELIAVYVKEHTLSTANLSQEDKNYIDSLLPVGAMKRNLNELKNIGAGKFAEILCFPTRGLLAEFSGFSADACWTQTRNIMRENPEMTAIFFVSSPDNASARRLAGATLLIETSVKGESAIIIRGVDPKQNLITQFTSKSFWQSLLNYVESICRKRKIKKILLPLHNQQALTNRPSLGGYLDVEYEAAPRVVLDKPCNFNGYGITDACVVVRDLSPV